MWKGKGKLDKQGKIKKKLTITIDVNIAGGAERQAVVLANHFANAGYKVTIINADRNSAFYPLDNKIKVIKMGFDYSKHGLPYSAIRVVKKFLFLISYIRKHRDDTVLTLLTNMEVPTIIAAKLCGVRVYTLICNDARKEALPLRLFRTTMYPKIDGVIFQTERVRAFKDFENVKKSIVVENPLMQEIDKRQIPISYVQRSNKIFTAGRLVQVKNQEGLIRAFARLAVDYTDLKLFIYGDGSLKEQLSDLIYELGMNERVFLPGAESDVIRNNREALLFVLNSYSEGMPNALMEAMAYGIPSISTDFPSGAARELIDDGISGFLVPVDNVDALEQKMRYVLEHPDIADKAAVEATKIYDKCNAEKICAKWEEFMFGEMESEV